MRKECQVKATFRRNDFARKIAMEILANAIASRIIRDENAAKEKAVEGKGYDL